MYYSKNIKYIILISPQSPSTFHRMDSHTVGSSVISGEKARPLFIRSPLTEKKEQDWASGGLLRIGTWLQARVFHHTIEGQAKTDAEGNVTELTPIQKAFIEKFSFQCGYCTPGFVAGATAFIDRLKHEPVKRADLESAIEDALNDHICRCTGYVRYYEAVRDVALATPGCVIGSVD